jgi:hypothetical protein
MGMILMASIRTSDVRHSPLSLVNHKRIRILIKSVVDLDKIENFRISPQRRLAWNTEVSPPAGAN